MFPWFPFFVFPDRRKKTLRGKKKKNLPEEIFEVRVSEAINSISNKTTSKVDDYESLTLFKWTPMPASMQMRFNYSIQDVTKKKFVIDELPCINQIITEEVIYLPKAPSEYLHVEFNEVKEQANSEVTNKIIDTATLLPPLRPKSSTITSSSASDPQICKLNSGRSSSMGQSSKKSSSGKSGKSSSKQQSNSRSTSTHRSTGSIAAAMNKIQIQTPPRRRRSAFETSTAMRELFGNSEESPFVGTRNKAATTQNDEVIANKMDQKQIDKEETQPIKPSLQSKQETDDTNIQQIYVDKNISTTNENKTGKCDNIPLKSVARVAPFAHLPTPAPEEELQAFQTTLIEHSSSVTLNQIDNRIIPASAKEKLDLDEIKLLKELAGSDIIHNSTIGNGQIEYSLVVDEYSFSKEKAAANQKGPLELTAVNNKIKLQGKDAAQQQSNRSTQKFPSSTGSGPSGSLGGSRKETQASFVGSSESIEMVNESASNSAGMANGVGRQLLIRNATVVNDDDIFFADVLIENGIIREIGHGLKAINESCEQIDANGRCLLPAGIDAHTTLLSISDNISMGTKAALSGGNGTVIDVLNCETNDDILSTLNQTKMRITNVSECNIALGVALGKWQGNQSRQDMSRFIKHGVNNFLLDFTDDVEIFEALNHAKTIGAFCRIKPRSNEAITQIERKLKYQDISGSHVHSIENKLNAQQIQILCSLAEMANVPLAIQLVNNIAAIEAIRDNHSSGVVIAVEIPIEAIYENCQNTEFLNLLNSLPNCMVVSGETKRESVNSELIQGRMSILWKQAVVNGKIDPMKFVAFTSANAARAFNLYPKKGRIAIGSDADLVLWNLKTQPSQNPEPHIVILNGQIRYQSAQFFSASDTRSKQKMFLPLIPNSIHLFGIPKLREGTFDFAEFISNSQQQGNNQETPKTTSNQSTRNGSPDEPIVAGLPASTSTQASRNRNTQSDQPNSRSTTKVIQPPGGKSTAFW